jgi:hypothetical protein
VNEGGGLRIVYSCFTSNTNPVNSKNEFTIVKSLIIKGNP